MTTNNGWLGKPGVPLNPEEPGYHRLQYGDGSIDVFNWTNEWTDNSKQFAWAIGNTCGVPDIVAISWRYLGPAPGVRHYSDCAVNNEPALPAGSCDCGGVEKEKKQ